MKLILSLIMFLVFFQVSFSQYYYSDIITTQETNRQYLILKNNHVQHVSAKSFEGDGQPTSDFMLEQNITNNSATIVTTSEYPSSGNSISTSFYENDKINKTIDSTEKIKNTTTYSYDDKGNLLSINTYTEDVFMNVSSNELHQWFYENGLPSKMLFIKNNNDTTTVNLIKDEEQHIAEEHWIRNGKSFEKYYYYYNDQNLLTDVVSYNLKAQRLLPNYLFTYNDSGNIGSFTQIPQASSDYLVWQYAYLQNGLREKELCFNKQKQLIGRIQFNYQ